MKTDKKIVHDFWNEASCGEKLLMKGETTKDQFQHQRQLRYQWEPEILEFTQFEKYKEKKVLEIGVGLGADHQTWAEVGVDLYGIDLTPDRKSVV
jgi:2-polyprenyl-3-methyl-5-hydroxy-6-metoxy-1,4-benzoquinol methylase